MKNYSQSNEQDAIISYFGDYIGCFLDIGINDGITFSNTHALALNHWCGIGIDASKKVIDKAKELYKDRDDIFLATYAISDSVGKAVLYESDSHVSSEDVSLLSSLDWKETKRWKDNTFTPVEVEMLDFETLLDRLPYDTFDFLSLDIESLETKVLPQIDLRYLRTSLVCVEWNGRNFDFFDGYFKGQNFSLLTHTPENLIYKINY